jgi:tetratricopeptide (TPR) repeat protein
MSDGSVDRAMDALRQGDVAQARRLCLEIIRNRKNEPVPWRLLGVIDAARGDLEAARQALETSLDLDPLQGETLLELGRLAATQGRSEEALQRLREAAALDSGARVITRIGEALGNLGQVEEAEACFRRALDADPSIAAARFNLALARLAAGSPEDARHLLEEVVAVRPDLAPAWLQLGGSLNALGRYQEAVEAFRQHLALVPDSPVGLTWLGASLQFLGDFDAAERAYRAALDTDPELADAHTNLGKLLMAQGDAREAEKHFRRALHASPGHIQALSGLAARLDEEGRYEEALELAREGSSEAPAILGPIHARILRHLGRFQDARHVLETAVCQPGLPADARVQLAFSRAALADESGDYATAWQYAEAANRLRRDLMPDGMAEGVIGAMERAVAELRGVFRKDAIELMARSGSRSDRPVFLVGMPRSGKSLAEQVICSHASVAGAGELTALGDVSSELGRRLGGWPERAGQATTAMLEPLAKRYLEVLEQTAGSDAARVTDTMPFNFVHLGLIEMLFPSARVIHCVRHPLDLLVRCYFKNFAGRSLSFAFSTTDIARYFMSYRDLMNHWRDVSGLAVHVLRYESLVSEPEREIRRLLRFLDLPWDDACLRFHEPGVARSAGPTPVRRPLDPGEIGGWRHYADHLSDVARRLPVAEYADEGF